MHCRILFDSVMTLQAKDGQHRATFIIPASDALCCCLYNIPRFSHFIVKMEVIGIPHSEL